VISGREIFSILDGKLGRWPRASCVLKAKRKEKIEKNNNKKLSSLLTLVNHGECKSPSPKPMESPMPLGYNKVY
jgi:hypothetical protein